MLNGLRALRVAPGSGRAHSKQLVRTVWINGRGSLTRPRNSFPLPTQVLSTLENKTKEQQGEASTLPLVPLKANLESRTQPSVRAKRAAQ